MSDQKKPLPLCVDCIFHIKELGSVHHMCNWRKNPVTGGPGGFCDLERRYLINGSCGIQGKNFKPQRERFNIMFQLFTDSGQK